MSVRPETLETPERDLKLVNRGKGQKPAEDDVETLRQQFLKAMQEMQTRLESARTVEPQGSELHCRDCFRKGRDAAIRVIEAAKGK